MKILFLFITVFLCINYTWSQSDSTLFPVKANTDFASRYLWRGNDYFNFPCIQSDLQLVYKDKVGVGVWGSFSTANQPIQETDIYIFVTIQRFSIYFYDYFYPNYFGNHNYFDFDSNTTGHTLSIDASYTISEKLPLKENVYFAAIVSL